MNPLQKQLDRIKLALDAQASDESKSVQARATEDLRDGGILKRIPSRGDALPSFELVDGAGAIVCSGDLLERGPLVISVFRGVWCPYCSAELGHLQQSIGTLQELGAQLIAISPQSPAKNNETQARLGIDFPILSDVGNAWARRLSLTWSLPEELREINRRLGIDLASYNGDDSWELPIPTRLVVDQAGLIHSINSDPDYTRRPEISATLKDWPIRKPTVGTSPVKKKTASVRRELAFVLAPLPEQPGRLVRAHCRDRLTGYVVAGGEGKWSCILRCPMSWQSWSGETLLGALEGRIKEIYADHKKQWLANDTNYPILLAARFEFLPSGETGREDETTYEVRPPGHEAGREVINRMMEALNDPGAEARLAAREEKKDRRQTLVLVGYDVVDQPTTVGDYFLQDLAELRIYLKARKSQDTDDGVRFELKVGGET